MESCSYCNRGVFGQYILAEASGTRLELFNNHGNVCMFAHGDIDCSYEPKFCPECGRRLNQQLWYREETDNWI